MEYRCQAAKLFHSDPVMIFEHLKCRNLSYSDVVQIMALTESIWPVKIESIWPVKYVRKMNSGKMVKSYLEDNKHAEVWLIWDRDELVAHARIFPRVIFVGDQSLEVMAVSGVCVGQMKRCKGLGRYLVKEAFGLIDRGIYGVSLFQTSIPAFYKKFGAKEIGNKFYNSRNKSDPRVNPWWDRFIMVYPGHYDWPEGSIDLNGPAY